MLKRLYVLIVLLLAPASIVAQSDVDTLMDLSPNAIKKSSSTRLKTRWP